MAIRTNDGTTTYIGKVISTRLYISSLFETDEYTALVWDDETDNAMNITYAGRHWGGNSYGMDKLAEVDATEEVLEKYFNLLFNRHLAYLREKAWKDATDATIPGHVVKVIAGRKVKKGTTGTVKRSGHNAYGAWVLATWEDGSEGFISASNVAVDFPLDYMPGEDELATQAREEAEAMTRECTEKARANRAKAEAAKQPEPPVSEAVWECNLGHKNKKFTKFNGQPACLRCYGVVVNITPAYCPKAAAQLAR